jgi:DNA-directed RNA polymerase subunit RPC12/RpoP
MIGCEAAVEWVSKQDVADLETLRRVVNRMKYEFEKDIGAIAKKHKGMYRADFYTCGNCGAGISEPYWTYCPNCGYRIIKSESKLQTDCGWK